MNNKHIDLIARIGYTMVDFKSDCKSIFGSGTGTVLLHFASSNRAPILYYWNGNIGQRVWDNKLLDGPICSQKEE